MKILIDTNIFLDFTLQRAPYFVEASQILKACSETIHGYLTTCQTKDIYYFTRKLGGLEGNLQYFLLTLFSQVTIVESNQADVLKALASNFSDYEDALLHFSAVRHQLDYILTRNTKDFKHSLLPVISPTQFLEMTR